MCMHLKNGKVDRNNRKVDANGFLTGYKVVKDCSWKSPCYNYYWYDGYNVSSRKSKKVTKWELKDKSIYRGFHIFTNIVAARKYMHGHGCFVKIVKVYYRPKDIVSYGITVTVSKSRLKTVVVTRCFVESMESIEVR